jgi:hypothetical protein
LPRPIAIHRLESVHADFLDRAYALVGDTNLDGTVNLIDLLILLDNYGETGADWAQGDFNYDGVVNLTDLLALLNNYGQTAPEPSFFSMTSVPEPVSMMSVILCLALWSFSARTPFAAFTQPPWSHGSQK